MLDFSAVWDLKLSKTAKAVFPSQILPKSNFTVCDLWPASVISLLPLLYGLIRVFATTFGAFASVRASCRPIFAPAD
ncbi:hypothetical protein LZ31DRAFT_118433 [Colletotrichum somersetense]|nr:hypothetical protein LZ31DRAFT_118433 [Colletotrichum somersetense]